MSCVTCATPKFRTAQVLHRQEVSGKSCERIDKHSEVASSKAATNQLMVLNRYSMLNLKVL